MRTRLLKKNLRSLANERKKRLRQKTASSREDQINGKKRKSRANDISKEEKSGSQKRKLQENTKNHAGGIENQIDEKIYETSSHWKFVLESKQMKQYPGRKPATEFFKSQLQTFFVTCIDCGLQISPELLPLHRREYHEKALQLIVYTCDICNVRIQGKINLDGHMKFKHHQNFMKNHCSRGLQQPINDDSSHQSGSR